MQQPTVVEINDRTITVPSSWNELTLSQALNCHQIIMADTRKLFSAGERLDFIRIECTKAILGIDAAFLRAWENDCIAAYEDAGRAIYLQGLHELSQVVNFLFNRIEPEKPADPVTYQIALGLTRCPWPRIDYTARKGSKKKHYYAPADALDNATIYELGMAFMAFEKYMADSHPDDLHELLAILYRPPKPHTKENTRSDYQGDRRLPLLHHEATIRKRKDKLGKLNDQVKQLILFWFASCRQSIISQYPNIFKDPQARGEKIGNDYAWGGVLLQLADGIVHLDEVAMQPYQNALTYMSMLEDQRKMAEMKAAEQRLKSGRK